MFSAAVPAAADRPSLAAHTAKGPAPMPVWQTIEQIFPALEDYLALAGACTGHKSWRQCSAIAAMAINPDAA
jgi:hypothetical protein